MDYLDYLRQQLTNISDYSVRFNGFVGHNQLAPLLHQADVFVQPSIWGEPFPLSVIEAMAAGLPVVSSSVGGLPESVIDGETGLLVEPDNPEALANGMLKLIENKELPRRMGDVGAARAKEHFSWEAVVVSLNSLYRALDA
jgi:glycosyltransferase involved in cell wall biosynthesis